jgi:hypothetical protein
MIKINTNNLHSANQNNSFNKLKDLYKLINKTNKELEHVKISLKNSKKMSNFLIVHNEHNEQYYKVPYIYLMFGIFNNNYRNKSHVKNITYNTKNNYKTEQYILINSNSNCEEILKKILLDIIDFIKELSEVIIDQELKMNGEKINWNIINRNSHYNVYIDIINNLTFELNNYNNFVNNFGLNRLFSTNQKYSDFFSLIEEANESLLHFKILTKTKRNFLNKNKYIVSLRIISFGILNNTKKNNNNIKNMNYNKSSEIIFEKDIVIDSSSDCRKIFRDDILIEFILACQEYYHINIKEMEERGIIMRPNRPYKEYIKFINKLIIKGSKGLPIK